jgi:hypothetical protein
MTWLGSFTSQAPSSREVPSPKPQRALDGHHIARALVWSLRFGASPELGVLGLVLWCAPYSIENGEDFQNLMAPPHKVMLSELERIHFFLVRFGQDARLIV